MHEELVKRLEVCRKRVVIGLRDPEASRLAQTITDAMVALSQAEHRETYGPTQNNRRTGPEDRRKSGYGSGPLTCRTTAKPFGRRSGDRARWTGEKVEDAPRDVPLVEWLDRRYQEPSGISKRRMDLRDLSAFAAELDRRERNRT